VSSGVAPLRARRLGTLVLTCAALVLFTVVPALQPSVDAELPDTPGDRYAGLEWRFVRIRYHFHTEGTQVPQDFEGEPWFIDAPAADQNLSRRVKTATAIQVEDPIVLPLDDPRLFQHPWIYFVAREMRRVFPDREIVEVPKDHPVFTSFYRIDGYPQVPGIGSFMEGRTWEKGGFVPHLRTILDDAGRPMMFINWNTDMGDGWEWSNVAEFPGYVKYTAMAYQMAINEIIYSLTH
jgi:hypothetical protein